MGDTSETIISAEEERALGEAFMRQARRSLVLVEDPEIDAYVGALGMTLASYSDYRGGSFSFFVVNDPRINAFAAPGGYIGINSGLILATESESELASVVAHEIAHVTQRHLPRAIESASKMALPTAAALLTAVLLGQSNPELGEAALATTLAGHTQSQINFTRANEKEADHIGIQLVGQAGFDPRGMPAFFEKLQQAYRYQENNLPEFLSTHPVTVARIADSRGRAEQFPPRASDGLSNYATMKAKLRVLTTKPTQQNVDYFKAELQRPRDGKDSSAMRYGLALALLEQGQAAAAQQHLEQLLEDEPDRSTYLLALARAQAARGGYDDAVATLELGLDLFPGHRPLTLAYVETLLQDRRPADAYQVMREYTRQRSDSPLALKLLARAAREAGRDVESHQAMAEYYYQLGELEVAIEQLKIARTRTDKENFYQNSRIEARLKQWEAEKAGREEKQ